MPYFLVLYIFLILISSFMSSWQISHSIGYHFTLTICSLCCVEGFQFDVITLVDPFIIYQLLTSYSGRYYAYMFNISITSSSSYFRFLPFTLRPLIHVQLIFVLGYRQREVLFESSTYGYPIFPGPFVGRADFPPKYFGTFVRIKCTRCMN